MGVRAYFSHSYRWQQKKLNYRIWELLRPHFEFAIDPADADRLPMEIASLEDMMRRSACFIAVVPQRPELRPQCSPYQLFENGLAIRAQRPRLLFVEQRLEKSLFGPSPHAYIEFDLDGAWLSDDRRGEVEGEVAKFAQRVTTIAPMRQAGEGPVGLLLPEDDAYPARERVGHLVEHELGRTPRRIRLTEIHSDHELISACEECAVVICETRGRWIPLDVLGILNYSCVPTIRLCCLNHDETEETASTAMKLSRAPDRTLTQVASEFPVIYAGYRVGNEMHPIVFWHQPEDVEKPIRERLDRITRPQKLLRDDNTQEGINYFLQLGRVPGYVFISNKDNLNPFVKRLRPKLLEKGVQSFHYTDPDAIPPGHPDYTADLDKRVKNSAVFLALINREYAQSEWCITELEAAVARSQHGGLAVVPFLMEDVEMPSIIQYVQAPQLHRLGEDEDKIKFIVKTVVNELEPSERIKIDDEESRTLTAIMGSSPKEKLEELIRGQLEAALVPETEIETLFEPVGDDAALLTILLDRLLDLARRSYKAAIGLGRFLNALAYEEQFDPGGNAQEVRGLLARLVHKHRLLPDVRFAMARTRPHHEIGIARISARNASGGFEAIEKGKLVDFRSFDDNIADHLYASLVESAATAKEWQEAVERTGQSLGKLKLIEDAMNRVNGLLAAGDMTLSRADLGLCLYGDEQGLEIPFEWYSRPGKSAPLCMEHPLRRVLEGSAEEHRLTVRASLLHGTPTPLRALLVAIDAGGIPRVIDEVEGVAKRLRKRFVELGWPSGKLNVNVITTNEAKESDLYDEIRRGGYDIFHFAAHGEYSKGEPGIRLRPDDSEDSFLPAFKLARWASESKLKFVYLSCCGSAAAEAGQSGGRVRLFDNLVQAFVKQSVPEVVGFLWPIEDRDSLRFAGEFYKHFALDFRSTTALFRARREFPDSRLWAAPVLYSRCETQDV